MIIRIICLILWAGLTTVVSLNAQDSVRITFHCRYAGKKVVLDEPMPDAMQIQTLRLYVSRFVLLKNNVPVFEESDSYHLLDLENPRSLSWSLAADPALEPDQLQFNLGIDSLTHVSGALGGDLDPTRGMFWTWQSGYINAKLEGICQQCATSNHSFQLHLGGYQSPYATVQTVRLNKPKGKNLALVLDLASFFAKMDWSRKCNIMSPCQEAVDLSRLMANCFSLHAE